MLFQKTLKSIQQHIHSVSHQLRCFVNSDIANSVSASAWTRARAKMSHSTFIEFNEEHLVKGYYENDHFVYKGYRLLALDGSIIRLPNSQEIADHLSYGCEYFKVYSKILIICSGNPKGHEHMNSNVMGLRLLHHLQPIKHA